MAAIFIVAGLAIADKVEKKKEQRRQKKASDEARYRELQIETSRRLARQNSTTTANTASPTSEKTASPTSPNDVRNDVSNSESAFVEDPEEEEEEWMHVAVDDPNPPPYEDAVQVGERRERQWQAQMQRRRSSVVSQRSQSGTGSTYMRMG